MAARPRICVLAVVLVASALTACGGDDDGDGESPKPAAETSSAPTPIGCLEKAGLENPEQRAPGLWRATAPVGGLILVERMPSPADARQAEREADLVVSESAGRYFVHGPVLDADDGSTAAVAACLRGE
jgi:hypothetical protein